MGASSAANGQWPNSNHGAAVDLFAPGENVRVLNFANPRPGSYELMSGTSPAAALAASAAIIELSKNPLLKPAEVEAALTTDAYPASPKALIQVQPSPDSDSDGDGTCDLLETFAGSNPADAAVTPSPLRISHESGLAQFDFPVAASLFNPEDPFRLSNGATWRILCSSDLTRWDEAPGTLTPSEARNSEIPLNFKMPSSADACFFRIEIIPAP